MDRRILQTYSVWAKENLEKQIEVSLKTLGINSDKDIKEAKQMGDVTIIAGDPNSYPKELYHQRKNIVDLVLNEGYQTVIEELAYTWFNRFVALRFMEVHDFLPHGFRVLSSRDGNIEPEILKNLNFVKDDLRLDLSLCANLKEQGKIEELYRYILFRQCKSLAGILPMLFAAENDYLELLLPKTLLKGETVLTRLVEIPEENFLNDVEIIGWMYQFYISVKKDEVFASKKTITKDTLPAVTQLFTPDWIVRYMAENSVGRIWLESYPNSALASEMKYYVPNPEQSAEVQRKLDAIKYTNVNPEDISVIEPCCGSGHILVYVFDLLYKMYEEKGYQKREIPTLILKNNLTGLDVDKRAAQLASFSLVMKARSVNPRFFSETYYVEPHVYEIWDSRLLRRLNYKYQLNELKLFTEDELADIDYLVESFRDGKTIGSLLKLKPVDFVRLDGAIEKLDKQAVLNIFNQDLLTNGVKLLKRLSRQAKILLGKYDVMITNPPYIGISNMEDAVKQYANKYYPNSKADMFAMFMETGFVKSNGFMAMINMHSWMFLSSFERLRESLLATKEIVTMAHLGAHAFDSIGGEVVQTTTFAIRNTHVCGKGVYFRLVDSKDKEADFVNSLFTNRGGYRFLTDFIHFSVIPGSPIAYWVSESFVKAFTAGKAVSHFASPKQGMSTCDVNRFVKLWSEVDITRTNIFERGNHSRWVTYNKGGECRKWYGNKDCVVLWNGNGDLLRQNNAALRNQDAYFLEFIAWTKLSSYNTGFRDFDSDNLFDGAGGSLFMFSKDNKKYFLGCLNSNVVAYILSVISPTLNFNESHIGEIPVIVDDNCKSEVDRLVADNIDVSSKDWDSFEVSWDFKRHPLI